MDGLANSGIPLGGLGTGSVELRGDGYFHEWQIMNNAPWGAGPGVDCPPDTSFFGLHVRGEGVERSAILGTPGGMQSSLNDPYSMPWVVYPERISHLARFPLTVLCYDFQNFPVAVALEAFSPFIPHDAKNSALPVAFFTFTVANRTGEPLEVSLFQALRNLTGYSKPEALSVMQRTNGRGRATLVFGREKPRKGASDTGTMALAAMLGPGARASHVLHARFHNRDIWDSLRETGHLDNSDQGSYSGAVGNVGAGAALRLRQGLPIGALCQTVTLAPHRSVRLRFVLAWHFPNFRERDYPAKKLPGKVIGTRYSEWFADAGEVAAYAARRFDDLHRRTMAFQYAFHGSDAQPNWLLDAASSQLSTLVKSSWWDLQGRFGIWEGLGCCGLQTTDITYYGSFPIVQLFPEIQKSQMRLTRDNVEVAGKIPHMMPGTFACCDTDHLGEHAGRIDLIPQFILLVWRDVLWTGDRAYAREMWPTVLDALRHFETFDTDGDGLPNNAGPDQTYDQFPLRGTSAFVGYLFAASLEAAADMAHLLGDTQRAAALRTRLAEVLEKLHAQLWTGSYYRLSHNPADGASNDGVMTDQVNADWFLRQSRGGGLLPDKRVRSALLTVLAHCRRPEGYVANCAWPDPKETTRIGRHTADQANWPWSGVEYAFAAHLVLMGLEKEGLDVAHDVWMRYERTGLRFNHSECGSHYYRAMSAWAVYLAATGFGWDARAGELTLRLPAAGTYVVFVTPTGWGRLQLDKAGAAVTLQVVAGKVAIRRLLLRGAKAPITVQVSRAGPTAPLTPGGDGAVVVDLPGKEQRR
jgi:uncharacterized protein (DUF608 family)